MRKEGKIREMKKRKNFAEKLKEEFLTTTDTLWDNEVQANLFVARIRMDVNAGHEHPAIRRSGKEFCLDVYKHSPAVAAIEGMTFREHEFKLKPGDSFFVYTDGVAEAMNSSNELFGTDRMLDALNKDDQLPKTILYSLDPSDNEFLDTILGAFQGEDVPGKIQHGSAWWFNDNKQGMRDQLTSLANLSLLGNFVGMLTDSRSFLSYTRHEYFRRILCDLIGGWIENGEYPADFEFVGEMVKDICYYNAKRYFNLEELV
jgi:hypothetical protein